MMASRKAILDKNKQQLLDSVNASNKIYTNEELSILLAEQQEQISSLKSELAIVKADGKIEEIYDAGNGYCWKYSNGLQMCRNKLDIMLPSIVAWGTAYYFPVTNVWTYASPFVSTTLFAYCNSIDPNVTLMTGNIYASATQITRADFVRMTNAYANTTVKISCMTIGKWK